MPQLWIDIIDPARLSGYMRESAAAYEARRGQLAQFLPNREVPDTRVKFTAGSSGLTEVANYRAWDAPPETAKRGKAKDVSIDLPPLGKTQPIGEYEQLRQRNAGDNAMLKEILKTADELVRSIVDRTEWMRGVVLATGRATVDQGNFGFDDNFGRSASHSVTAATLWSDPDADRLGDLQAWCDVYEDDNGAPPGAIVLSRRGMRALQMGRQFQTQLVNGHARNATPEEVRAILESNDLPPVISYNRRVNIGGTKTPVLPTDTLLLLPEPVDINDGEGSELGSTFWGQTLSANAPEWGIEPAEQPGIVAGVYRHQTVPMIAEIQADAIALPVLANADLSLAARIL